ncbi:MAG: hypothetical protein HYX75_16445 [Acidobacteria bacterium]|nr:hypothetical protein [Acidobacteriota bacterium]
MSERRLRGRSVAGPAAGCEDDHAKVSQFTLQQLVADSLRQWAAVSGAHHGKIKGDRLQPIAENNHAAWAAECRALIDEVTLIFGPLPTEQGDEAALWMTAGLTTVADWIGSDETLFGQTWTGSIDERRQRARDALAAVRWESSSAKAGLGFEDLFPSFKANALQAVAWENIVAPGLYVIEGPMGCGKTEAALGFPTRVGMVRLGDRCAIAHIPLKR